MKGWNFLLHERKSLQAHTYYVREKTSLPFKCSALLFCFHHEEIFRQLSAVKEPIYLLFIHSLSVSFFHWYAQCNLSNQNCIQEWHEADTKEKTEYWCPSLPLFSGVGGSALRRQQGGQTWDYSWPPPFAIGSWGFHAGSRVAKCTVGGCWLYSMLCLCACQQFTTIPWKAKGVCWVEISHGAVRHCIAPCV